MVDDDEGNVEGKLEAFADWIPLSGCITMVVVVDDDVFVVVGTVLCIIE